MNIIKKFEELEEGENYYTSFYLESDSIIFSGNYITEQNVKSLEDQKNLLEIDSIIRITIEEFLSTYNTAIKVINNLDGTKQLDFLDSSIKKQLLDNIENKFELKEGIEEVKSNLTLNDTSELKENIYELEGLFDKTQVGENKKVLENLYDHILELLTEIDKSLILDQDYISTINNKIHVILGDFFMKFAKYKDLNHLNIILIDYAYIISSIQYSFRNVLYDQSDNVQEAEEANLIGEIEINIYKFNHLFNLETTDELHSDIVLLQRYIFEFINKFDNTQVLDKNIEELIFENVEKIIGKFFRNYYKNYEDYFEEEIEENEMLTHMVAYSEEISCIKSYVMKLLQIRSENNTNNKKLSTVNKEDGVNSSSNILNSDLSAANLYDKVIEYFEKYIKFSNSTGNNSEKRFTIKENLDNSISKLAECPDDEIYQLINNKDFNLQRLLEVVLHGDIQDFDFAAKIQKIISTSSTQ